MCSSLLHPDFIPPLPFPYRFLQRSHHRGDIPYAVLSSLLLLWIVISVGHVGVVVVVMVVKILQLGLVLVHGKAQLPALGQVHFLAVVLEIGVCAGEGAVERGLFQGGEALGAEVYV